MHRIEGGADRDDRVFGGNQGGELQSARHFANTPRRKHNGMFEPQQLFLGIDARKTGQTMKRSFQSVAQDKRSHTILKDRPVILLHVLSCPPIRSPHHVIAAAAAQFHFCNI